MSSKKFLTRKRGTQRQIGQKFPVTQKKTLPARISLGGKKSPFTNWVVVIKSKKGKRVWSRVGVATKEEAEKRANEERLELLRSGKDRWYEVIITSHQSGGKLTPQGKYLFYEWLKQRGLSEMEIADILESMKSGGKISPKKLRAAIDKKKAPLKVEKLYYMAKNQRNAIKKAKEENPKMVVVSTKIKSYWPDYGLKEYEVNLRPKSR